MNCYREGGCGPYEGRPCNECPYSKPLSQNDKPHPAKTEEAEPAVVRWGLDSVNPYGADDPVNHPAHYTAGGIECIDAIAAALTCQKDPMEAWLTGQVLKYLWRWPLKNGKEDLEKARFYLNRLIEKVSK